MKKIDLGQTLGILANFGVIAGIIFLGVELQQNNEFLATQARTERGAISREAGLRMLQNPDLRRATIKARSGGVLSEDERFLLELENEAVITDWRIIYQEYQLGALEESALNIAGWRDAFHVSRPRMPEFWSANKQFNPPEFVQWMDENVVNER